MATETIVVCSCDLCGERRPEQDMHMDISWSWNGRRLKFDADADCFSTVEVMSIMDLVKKSRPDTTTPAEARANKRKAKRIARPTERADLKITVAGNGQRVRRFTSDEYAKHYRKGRKWSCPACEYTTTSKDHMLLSSHYRAEHGRSLWQDLEERITAELVGGTRESALAGR